MYVSEELKTSELAITI